MICNKHYNLNNVTIRIVETQYNSKVSSLFFYFYQRGKRIGHIEVERTDFGRQTYQTHSEIVNYHSNANKGLGLFMYSAAVDWVSKKGWTLCSYKREYQSSDAHRLWASKRLRKKYIVSKFPKKDRWLIKLRPVVLASGIRSIAPNRIRLPRITSHKIHHT